MVNAVEIVEVGARDGLQNEQVIFSTEQKLHVINGAIAAGVKRLEVASFVHPKYVPQMADAEDVIANLQDIKDVEYIGLVLNERGFHRALKTREGNKRGVDEVGLVAVASDGFGEKNQGQTSAQSVDVCRDILKSSKSEGISAQVTISVAFGCPFDGEVSIQKVVDIAKELAEDNPREIAIADTIGVGDPRSVTEMVGLIKLAIPHIPIRAHFHNTRNTGYANAWAAYAAGATVLDSSIAGLGGCPFAPNATGNIATEDLQYMLERARVKTGLNLDLLIELATDVEGFLGRQIPAQLGKAGIFPR